MKTVVLTASLLLAAALPSYAEKVCQNVYNPMTGKWEYQCTEGHAPQCHQEYDALNNVWVTVCN